MKYRSSPKTRLLFVCTANRHRSRTAQDIFGEDSRYEVLSAGTDACEDDPDEQPVTADMVDWADLVFVMEEYHRRALSDRLPGCENKIVVLDIPDLFYRGDPRLVEILRQRVPPHLG
ncbi:MAG: phosphotyrosine protein phosphatase [Acidobacteria bacterium]|nr:phosphotyrosine protein phosphatase [Acidobacteriota bacterium]